MTRTARNLIVLPPEFFCLIVATVSFAVAFVCYLLVEAAAMPGAIAWERFEKMTKWAKEERKR
jgi:hypothetical protein